MPAPCSISAPLRERFAHTGNLVRVSRLIKAGGSPTRVSHFPTQSPCAWGGRWRVFRLGFNTGRRSTLLHPDARREPFGHVPGPVNFPRGPEPDQCRSRSAAQELALPTSVLADFGRIFSWSDKSIKARWRNEAGDLFLDEAAKSPSGDFIKDCIAFAA
jgi:hypothetical protein